MAETDVEELARLVADKIAISRIAFGDSAKAKFVALGFSDAQDILAALEGAAKLERQRNEAEGYCRAAEDERDAYRGEVANLKGLHRQALAERDADIDRWAKRAERLEAALRWIADGLPDGKTSQWRYDRCVNYARAALSPHAGRGGAVSKPVLEIHYAGDWAALYVDGFLEEVGDSDITEEKALRLLDVKCVYDDAFMRGQTQRDGVARNLAEVESYRVRREGRQAEAARLRAEAERLLNEAKELDGAAG